MAGRCPYQQNPGLCCRDLPNNNFYLAQVECGLRDERTCNEFKHYLAIIGNSDKIRLIKAYKYLTKAPNGFKIVKEMQMEECLLLPNPIELIEDVENPTPQNVENLKKAIEEELRHLFRQFADSLRW